MNLVIVNPNTTAAMTARIGQAGQAAAASGTRIRAVNPPDGPVSIEGYFDEAFSVPGLLREILRHDREGQAQGQPVNAYILACFDDTGLDAARCATAAPVIGIGEAAFHLASLVAGRFSVITTLSRSIGAIEHNLVRYGLAARCAQVRASEVAVLDLEAPGSPAQARIDAEIAAALREDRAEAIVLGCAGMAHFAAELSRRHGVPVIDGVAAAVKLAEALVGLGLQTSKVGGYAAPLPKTYLGQFQDAQPLPIHPLSRHCHASS
jgi:allantoin racemase